MSTTNYLNSITGISSGQGQSLSQGFGTGLGTGLSQGQGISKITIFGITVLFIYTITNILNFYGIGVDKYGAYLMFYIFLLFCYFILDRDYPKT
jgi:hypothetical protein